MKTISIGSSRGCNICINDASISKQHALILISKWGKLQIVNLGASGTLVNGVRIRSHVPTPLKRNNSVMIGGVYQLDWKLVPDPRRKYIYSFGGLVVLMIIIILMILLCSWLKKDAIPETTLPPSTPTISIPTTAAHGQDEEKTVTKSNTVEQIPTPQELWVGSGKKLPVNKPSQPAPQKATTKPQRTDTLSSVETNKVDSIIGEDVPLDVEIEIEEGTEEGEE